MTSRIIINNRTDLGDIEALKRVIDVMGQGKCSLVKGKPQYCFASGWHDGISVYANLKYKSDTESFTIIQNDQ